MTKRAAVPIITVASGKGGVGKTTTVLALAAALAEPPHVGEPPYVLDLDPGADATWGSGLEPGGDRIVFDSTAPLATLAELRPEGFAIVPGSPSMMGAEMTYPVPKIAQWLRAAGKARTIIVDTSPSLSSAFTRGAIAGADLLIVPIVPEPLAARRAQHVLAVLEALDVQPPPLVLIIATIVDARRAITAAIVADLEASGLHIDAVIPRSVAVAEAPRTGKTLLAYAPKSPTANEYRQLARTVRAMLRNAKR